MMLLIITTRISETGRQFNDVIFCLFLSYRFDTVNSTKFVMSYVSNLVEIRNHNTK